MSGGLLEGACNYLGEAELMWDEVRLDERTGDAHLPKALTETHELALLLCGQPKGFFVLPVRPQDGEPWKWAVCFYDSHTAVLFPGVDPTKEPRELNWELFKLNASTLTLRTKVAGPNDEPGIIEVDISAAGSDGRTLFEFKGTGAHCQRLLEMARCLALGMGASPQPAKLESAKAVKRPF